MATTVPYVAGGAWPPSAQIGTNTMSPGSNVTGGAVATDDLMILITSAASGAALRIPTFPGWTTVREHAAVNTGGSATFAFGVYVKFREEGETSYTYDATNNTNSFGPRLIFVRGVRKDITKVVYGAAQARQSATASTTPSYLEAYAPSVTAVANNTLALAVFGERTNATETDAQVTVSSGWTKSFQIGLNGASDQTLVAASKTVAKSAASGLAVLTYPNSHGNNAIGIQFALEPIPDAAPAVSGFPMKRSNGTTLETVYVKYSDGTQLLDFKGLKQAKPGYPKVSTMLSQAEFFCAHRGGSREFPEMSLMAYGQSVLWGYPALELSVARTIDGVWFGLHDASLDRTSYNTGGGSGTTYVASNMTWAQVQATPGILGSMANNNPTQPSRPYARWEEIMDMYYGSHVFFIDPKAAYNFRGELLDKMDAMPGNPRDRFVGKYYGVVGNSGNTGTSWPIDLRARGYKGWGYFYEADQSNFAAYQGRWDILGMDYGASQASWDALKAARTANQPIMGHICPDAAAVATARTKGATGFMVSGVKTTLPPAVTPFGGFGNTNFGSNPFGV